MKHTIIPVNMKVDSRYRSNIIKEKASFNVKLPDFAPSKSIFVSALVKEDPSVDGRHNIIFGSVFL